MPDFDLRAAALVLIDLQNGIVGMPLEPRSGTTTLATGKSLAGRFRAAGAPVILLRVAFAEDFADRPPPRVDQPMARPEGGLPADWSTLAEGLAQPTDIVIIKRQWGAFYGTELDLQLRRRGVRTIVLGGVATNFGVESTARQAWEHGYEVVLVEDACAGISAELHDMAIRHIFPRIARVAQSRDITFAGASGELA
ncbi:hydrolase [Methylocella tundrae]|uniref:hydrolase n=1 Tax=Methylocella tundrae TaxID=227605 RepID=UPI0030FE5CDB|nr:hydrolase [Methylocella tundrae]